MIFSLKKTISFIKKSKNPLKKIIFKKLVPKINFTPSYLINQKLLVCKKYFHTSQFTKSSIC